MRRIHGCAQAALLHADNARMPMGYQTLVGDLGHSLSGGQKQRLLLAQLPLTRLIIAHRPDTIAGAQRVVQLKEGQVAEVVRVVGEAA